MEHYVWSVLISMSYTKVYLLPRNAIGYIFQLQPYFVISSFIPPREQNIRQNSVDLNDFYEYHCSDCEYRESYDEDLDEYIGECEGGEYQLKQGSCYRFDYEDFVNSKGLKIKTLPYIFQVRISFLTGIIHLPSSYLLTYDPVAFQNGELKVVPYTTGNVYSGSGNICWGNSFNRIDEDSYTPRLVHSMFWESVFNNDLVPNGDVLTVWLKNLTAEKIIQHTKTWEDYTRNVKGEVFIGTNEKVEGVFFSNEPSVTRKFKKSVLYKHREDGRNRRGVIGWLKKGDYRLTTKATVTFNGLYVEVGEDTFAWNSEANTIGKRVYIGIVPESPSPSTLSRLKEELLDRFIDEVTRGNNTLVEAEEDCVVNTSGLVMEMLNS